MVLFEDTKTDQLYKGISLVAGFGKSISGGSSGEAHILWGKTGTWNATKFNIFDKLDHLYDYVKGW